MTRFFFLCMAVWRQLGGADVAFPPEFAAPIGIIHFIGGSVVGSVPKAAYGPFIEKLASEVCLCYYRYHQSLFRSYDTIKR